MICPTGITKYFLRYDWTTQIRLNRLKKIVFPRTRLCLFLASDKSADIRKISTDLPVGQFSPGC